MFTTRVHARMYLWQFASLADHNIEGMDMLIKNFFQLVDEFKRKPYKYTRKHKRTRKH